MLLNYFNSEINFIFSCEIRSWSLRFRQFDIGQVNTAQINTLVHNIVLNIWAKFGVKNIQAFLRYSNFRVGIFYFASPCRVKVIWNWTSSVTRSECRSCLIAECKHPTVDCSWQHVHLPSKSLPPTIFRYLSTACSNNHTIPATNTRTIFYIDVSWAGQSFPQSPPTWCRHSYKLRCTWLT